MIRSSVGNKGVNSKTDVKIVQKVLNRAAVAIAPVSVVSALPGFFPTSLLSGQFLLSPLLTLKEDGIYGPTTQAAIDHVQGKLGIKNTNGLITPRGQTLLKAWPVAYKNPTGKPVRVSDPMGKGHFGASRGTRTHKGTDYTATVGQKIKAPMSGFVKRVAIPYSSGKDHKLLRGVEIIGADGHKCKIWYMSLEANIVGSMVTAGQEDIGTLLTLQNRHGKKITEHVHVEIRTHAGSVIDPTTLIK